MPWHPSPTSSAGSISWPVSSANISKVHQFERGFSACSLSPHNAPACGFRFSSYYKVVVSIAALLRSLALRACARTKAGCNLCSGRASGYAGNRRSATHRECCHCKGSASSRCPSSTPGTSAPPPTAPESIGMRDLQLERVNVMAQLLRCAQSVGAGFPLTSPKISVSRDGPQAQRRWSRPLLYVET